MKRDMDLIRGILLALESGESWGELSECQSTIGYHCYLIVDAGLATGNDITCLSDDYPSFQLYSLTWAGHEFLDTARETKHWEKAKSLILDKAGGASIAVWTKVLTNQIMFNLGITGS